MISKLKGLIAEKLGVRRISILEKRILQMEKVLFSTPARSSTSITGEGSSFTIDGRKDSNVVVPDDEVEGLFVEIAGNNSTVRVHESAKFSNTRIEVGNDDCEVVIGADCRLENVHIRCCFGGGQVCHIGDGTVMYGASIVLDEDSHVIIGKNCLFAGSLEMWAADGHTIFNKETGKVLNKGPYTISIGDHCWIGIRVTIIKDTHLPDNVIVGAGAVLSGRYDKSHAAIVSSKTRVVGTDLDWSNLSIRDFERKDAESPIEV